MAVLTVATTAHAEAVSGDRTITVYRDPSCGCCNGWIDHLSAAGFQPINVPTDEMAAIKQRYGVLSDRTSCHTAIVDGYVIEGHVPAVDIQRLLSERPAVRGITVPGMPIGTPGMEDGDTHEPFTVFSFDENGTTMVFRASDR